jgi:hypothetical protein
MASQPKYDPEKIREVIRLLKLAIEDCQRLLSASEEAVHGSKQDNDSPIRKAR